jgi:hypothetical protein
MKIVTRLLGTDTTTATDVGTLRARHAEAAGRVAAGRAELERLTANVDKLRLARARLIDQRDLDPGLDLFEPIRAAEGALASAQKRSDDLQDVMRVRQDQAATLEGQVRAAERQEAPAQMAQLARHHAQKREALRTMAAELQALAHDIIVVESDMAALHNQHGVTAPGVMIIEGVATPAQALAADIVSKLAWQDGQQRLGDALADKLQRDRAEVDAANREAGYQLYRSPAAIYFTDGWVDETTDQRTARASG